MVGRVVVGVGGVEVFVGSAEECMRSLVVKVAGMPDVVATTHVLRVLRSVWWGADGGSRRVAVPVIL